MWKHFVFISVDEKIECRLGCLDPLEMEISYGNIITTTNLESPVGFVLI